jgi:hypothetical protein
VSQNKYTKETNLSFNISIIYIYIHMCVYIYIYDEPGSLVSIRTGRPGFDPRHRQRIFPLTSAYRPALRPTQPPVQWVPGALSPEVKRGRGVMLTTHPLLVPRIRKSRSYTSCHPNAPLWSVTGPLYLFLTFYYICVCVTVKCKMKGYMEETIVICVYSSPIHFISGSLTT